MRRRMRSAWLRIKPEEPGLGLLVVPRRTQDGFEKAGQGGERRAQLMAGIGHEIGAHALDLLFARQVAQHDKRAVALAQGRDMRPEAARHGHAEFILDVDRLLARGRRRHRLEHGGIADRGGEVEAFGIGLQNLARQRVGVEHAALAVHHQGGIGQAPARRRPADAAAGAGRRARRFGITWLRRGVTAEGPHDLDQWTGGLHCGRITRPI